MCHVVSQLHLGFLFSDAANVPVVCVVVNGGPNTLETVRSAIEKGTPAIIVEVFKKCFCGMNVIKVIISGTLE